MRKVIMIVIAVMLVGCGSTKGWRVTFGVAPVGNLQDTQGLKEEVKSHERY